MRCELNWLAAEAGTETAPIAEWTVTVSKGSGKVEVNWCVVRGAWCMVYGRYALSGDDDGNDMTPVSRVQESG